MSGLAIGANLIVNIQSCDGDDKSFGEANYDIFDINDSDTGPAEDDHFIIDIP